MRVTKSTIAPPSCRVGGRERAVQHVDAFDLSGVDQRPARREAGAVAEQVRQQDAVGVDQRTRAVAGARGAVASTAWS
jgi:hypothetical protein